MKTSFALATLLSFAFVSAASAATHSYPPHVEAKTHDVQHQPHMAKTQLHKEHTKQGKSTMSNEHLQPPKTTVHKKIIPHKKANSRKIS